MVSDLFLFAKVEYLKQKPESDWIDLEAFIKTIVEGFTLQASQKHIRIKQKIAVRQRSLLGDAYLLTRAIDNLLLNALHYTPEHGEIRFSVHEVGNQLKWSIEDNGPGIDPEDLPFIFKPLYRAEKSRNRQTGGAGLGLTIAKKIFLAHQGELVVKSELNRGTTIEACLPINPA